MSVRPSSVVEVNDLGKYFKQYARPSDRALEWLTGNRIVRHERRWGCRNVSFALRPGERLGVIGRNGAGKSTLLKMLAGVVMPSEGSFRIHGRVFSMLELGAGFNRQLTGRQNVLTTSALLGLPPGYAQSRMEDIEAFAELGEHFDRVVQTYSSGMFVRLAFSTFMFLEPQVLLVDEALSVGDFFFQQKCMEALRETLEHGTTLIFVSHNLGSIANICDRVLFMEHGTPRFMGAADEAIARYLASTQGKPRPPRTRAFVTRAGDATHDEPGGFGQDIVEQSILNYEQRMGSMELEIVAARVVGRDGCPTLVVESGEIVVIELLARARARVEEPNLGIALFDRLNQTVFFTHALGQGHTISPLDPGCMVRASFEVRMSLNTDAYGLVVIASAQHASGDPNRGVFLDRHARLGPIQVIWPHQVRPGGGIAWLDTKVDVEVVEAFTVEQMENIREEATLGGRTML